MNERGEAAEGKKEGLRSLINTVTPGKSHTESLLKTSGHGPDGTC